MFQKFSISMSPFNFFWRKWELEKLLYCMYTLEKAESGKCYGCWSIAEFLWFHLYAAVLTLQQNSVLFQTQACFLLQVLWCRPSTTLRHETITKVNLCKPKGRRYFKLCKFCRCGLLVLKLEEVSTSASCIDNATYGWKGCSK